MLLKNEANNVDVQRYTKEWLLAHLNYHLSYGVLANLIEAIPCDESLWEIILSWLTSDGAWEAPAKVSEGFQDTKPTTRLAKNAITVLKERQTPESIKHLTDHIFKLLSQVNGEATDAAVQDY